MYRTTLPGLHAERSTRRIDLVLRKEDGTAVQPTAITMRLYERKTEEAVDPTGLPFDVSVLNANGGSAVAVDGKFSLRLRGDGMRYVQPDGRAEAHVILLKYTWGTDGVEYHEVVLWVANMAQVA